VPKELGYVQLAVSRGQLTVLSWRPGSSLVLVNLKVKVYTSGMREGAGVWLHVQLASGNNINLQQFNLNQFNTEIKHGKHY
jgi:hypothetical protein